MALSGWNIYEKGLLSTIIEDSNTRPRWVKSYRKKKDIRSVGWCGSGVVP